MKINTGQGTIPLITLIGIWSVSALTSLPGLAVSPILGELSTIFPHATELDIQMLTSLPSLLIIPFVLLAGKLAEKRDFISLLRVGIWLFAASGVLYLFSSRMWQLMRENMHSRQRLQNIPLTRRWMIFCLIFTGKNRIFYVCPAIYGIFYMWSS